MFEILEIAGRLTEPVAAIAFVCGLVLIAYLYALRYRQKRIESLPSEQRARATDDSLTRYGLGAENLTREQKFNLLMEEMKRRFRLTIVALIVAAAVFVICFIATTLRIPSNPGPLSNTILNPAPTVPPQTTFSLQDLDTTDPILSPFEVRYRLKDELEPRTVVKRNQTGQFAIEAKLDQITFDEVHAPGYSSFKPASQDQLDQGIIKLQRNYNVQSKNEFRKAISPNLSGLFADDYQQVMSDQDLESGGVVSLHNESDFHITFLFYRWNPETRGGADPLGPDAQGANVRWAECPSRQKKDYSFHDYIAGGYYFVFASVCGLQAEPLAGGGNMHGPAKSTFVIHDVDLTNPSQPVFEFAHELESPD